MTDEKPKVKKAKQDIWMPLYLGDYLASTTRLTTEQHGAYLLLIIDYFKHGPLPDDDRVLAQICRMNADAWSNARSILQAYFKQSKGKWISNRIDEERIKASEKVEKYHARAVKAAEAKWNASRNASSNPASNASSIRQAMLGQCQSQSQSQSQLKSVKTCPTRAEDFLGGGEFEIAASPFGEDF